MHSYDSSFRLGCLGLNKLSGFAVSATDYSEVAIFLAIVSTCSLVPLCLADSSSVRFKAVTHLVAMSIV